MLYYLSDYTDVFSPLRIFRYITFRALMGAATAFTLSLVFGPWVIAWLRRLKIGQQVRTDAVLRRQATPPPPGAPPRHRFRRRRLPSRQYR